MPQEMGQSPSTSPSRRSSPVSAAERSCAWGPTVSSSPKSKAKGWPGICWRPCAPTFQVEPHGQDPSGLCERAGSGAIVHCVAGAFTLAPGDALTPGDDLTDTTLTDEPTGTDTGRLIGPEPSAVPACIGGGPA